MVLAFLPSILTSAMARSWCV